MRQPDLLSCPTPPSPEPDITDDRLTRPAPTYRPRKPVQQALDLEPGTFTLT